MLDRGDVLGGIAIAVFVLLLAGCGTEATPTTTTTTSVPEPTTSEPPDTTTTVTSVKVGPQPFPAGRFLEPGEYVTTVFQPTVLFEIARPHALQPIEERFIAGFFGGNFVNRRDPYRLIAVHGWWRESSPDEVIAELEAHESIGFGPATETTVGGLAGTQIDITIPALVPLWQDPTSVVVPGWFLGSRAAGRLIILETQAGTIVIIAEATEAEWDEFLPVAEEILAGISFPDLD